MLRRFFRILGPGFISGAADDDPSGIATYSHTGARFGYSQAWTALFSFPLMAVVQETCARIGLATGKGLTAVIKERYSRFMLVAIVLCLTIANIVNIGADIGAMASSGQMLSGLPFFFWLAFFAAVSIILQACCSYETYASILKYLGLSLAAYIVTAFVVPQDWIAVGRGLVFPSFSLEPEFLMNIVALFGTTISPYLFFWQTSEEVEESDAEPEARTADAQIARMRKDTWIGMFFSNFVMFFIIVTAASALRIQGITSIETADQAARALEPVAGPFASLLFAAAIISTGLLAIPVLSGGVAYAWAELLGWREGYRSSVKNAVGFYVIIALTILAGVAVHFLGIPPFSLLYYSAVLNGLCAPFLIYIIFRLASDGGVMGKLRNTKTYTVVGYFTALFMGAGAIVFLWSLL